MLVIALVTYLQEIRTKQRLSRILAHSFHELHQLKLQVILSVMSNLCPNLLLPFIYFAGTCVLLKASVYQ